MWSLCMKSQRSGWEEPGSGKQMTGNTGYKINRKWTNRRIQTMAGRANRNGDRLPVSLHFPGRLHAWWQNRIVKARSDINADGVIILQSLNWAFSITMASLSTRHCSQLKLGELSGAAYIFRSYPTAVNSRIFSFSLYFCTRVCTFYVCQLYLNSM